MRKEKDEGEKQDDRIWYSSNIVNLCMDSYDPVRQQGRLYHQYGKEPVLFGSVLEALDWMEKLYDRLRYPQASTRYRSFRPDRNAKASAPEQSVRMPVRKEADTMEPLEDTIRQRGERATFVIRVMHRQHTSWQGEVIWIDGQKKEYFRSALELLRLMDSVLQADAESKDGAGPADME